MLLDHAHELHLDDDGAEEIVAVSKTTGEIFVYTENSSGKWIRNVIDTLNRVVDVEVADVNDDGFLVRDCCLQSGADR